MKSGEILFPFPKSKTQSTESRDQNRQAVQDILKTIVDNAFDKAKVSKREKEYEANKSVQEKALEVLLEKNSDEEIKAYLRENAQVIFGLNTENGLNILHYISMHMEYNRHCDPSVEKDPNSISLKASKLIKIATILRNDFRQEIKDCLIQKDLGGCTPINYAIFSKQYDLLAIYLTALNLLLTDLNSSTNLFFANLQEEPSGQESSDEDMKISVFLSTLQWIGVIYEGLVVKDEQIKEYLENPKFVDSDLGRQILGIENLSDFIGNLIKNMTLQSVLTLLKFQELREKLSKDNIANIIKELIEANEILKLLELLQYKDIKDKLFGKDDQYYTALLYSQLPQRREALIPDNKIQDILNILSNDKDLVKKIISNNAYKNAITDLFLSNGQYGFSLSELSYYHRLMGILSSQELQELFREIPFFSQIEQIIEKDEIKIEVNIEMLKFEQTSYLSKAKHCTNTAFSTISELVAKNVVPCCKATVDYAQTLFNKTYTYFFAKNQAQNNEQSRNN
jgi:hypothetical protein